MVIKMKHRKGERKKIHVRKQKRKNIQKERQNNVKYKSRKAELRIYV